MIPAQHNTYEAQYRQENKGHQYFTAKPVVAWDEEGVALVVDAKAGRLVPADTYSNFARLTQADPAPVVAAIPGGGWTAEYRADDGSLFTMPVTVWTVRADGTTEAQCTDATGITADPTDDDNFVRLVEPGK